MRCQADAMRVGLPRMHQEDGERRDFLPPFVAALCRDGVDGVVLEEGYGSGMDVDPSEYLAIAPCVRFAPYLEVFDQDVVVVLRCPEEEAIRSMRPGLVLVSMLHYPTRPGRTALLAEAGLAPSASTRSPTSGRRLVENLEAVAWNGVRAAFREIQRRHPHFDHPSRRPLHVTCLGVRRRGRLGGVRRHALRRPAAPRVARRERTCRGSRSPWSTSTSRGTRTTCSADSSDRPPDRRDQARRPEPARRAERVAGRSSRGRRHPRPRVRPVRPRGEPARREGDRGRAARLARPIRVPPEDEAYDLIDPPDRHDEPAARAVVLLLAWARPRREHADVRRADRARAERGPRQAGRGLGPERRVAGRARRRRAEVSRWLSARDG